MKFKVNIVHPGNFAVPYYAVFYRNWLGAWKRYDDIDFYNYANAMNHLALIEIQRA